MKKFLLLTLCFLILGLTACSQSHPSSRDKSASSTIITSSSTTARTNAYLRQLSGKQIRLTIGDQSFTVDLYDNPTANDLYDQLPLTLTVNDYAGWDEKVIRLDKKLSMQDAPDGDEPLYPEVGYYEPGNWIALYYGKIGYWSGKIPLGKISATNEQLKKLPDGETVTIEKQKL